MFRFSVHVVVFRLVPVYSCLPRNRSGGYLLLLLLLLTLDLILLFREIEFYYTFIKRWTKGVSEEYSRAGGEEGMCVFILLLKETGTAELLSKSSSSHRLFCDFISIFRV